jgi:hypothetical protein
MSLAYNRKEDSMFKEECKAGIKIKTEKKRKEIEEIACSNREHGG